MGYFEDSLLNMEHTEVIDEKLYDTLNMGSDTELVAIILYYQHKNSRKTLVMVLNIRPDPHQTDELWD